MSGTSSKIYILDSLRGIIALFVALYHFLQFENQHGRLIPKDNEIVEFMNPLLIGSVSVFFIISAYVIFLHLEHHNYSLSKMGTYLWKRVVRIQIPVLICIALIILVDESFHYYLGIPSTFSWKQLLANVTLTAGFVGEEWYNPIFWTLCIEFQFYIAVGILFPLIKQYPLPSLLLLALAFIPINYYSDSLGFASYYGAYFVIGIALYLFHTKRFSWIELLLLLFVGFTDLFLNHPLIYPLIPICSIPLILFFKKRIKILELMGELSFSFYLIHGMLGGWLIYFTARYANNGIQQILIVIAALAISYIGSYYFYRIFEKPSLRWARKIKYKK
ncbi:MAG: peptidoglycan/LPS O-acetylase OafA/YrhL [Crocinitomicaceae bacterium]|jgi:peptidoglycan/LPS O-acetylase OafA/YrhL